ncbi:GIY-YIG nuclease family protein [Photobacterium carnosum]|uniref:GIY-YIG nuclease family protein n=1 Tax=Photobacterium carnosum TaxID=2023717 RepID=UPI001E3B2B70|nr:GIY-YIG nuclease family protein [Photobacterium carnosum]MCD9547773.1 GIY-YIG nuclease family protein [Photobacterium carnosum]MCD9557579.1 GIY-YIG nuclease family protein [Photobacterium carnosum]MCF2305612.1 GIY-YIG nuclease family protein [Photobacterium carnosum]
MSREPTVYILTSELKTVLYIGVTSQLVARIWLHKNNVVVGFSQKYQVHNLVHYEVFDTMHAAIAREKQLKKWRRSWKEQLITENNPQWLDLYDSLL